jgi:hypothetical protein
VGFYVYIQSSFMESTSAPRASLEIVVLKARGNVKILRFVFGRFQVRMSARNSIVVRDTFCRFLSASGEIWVSVSDSRFI